MGQDKSWGGQRRNAGRKPTWKSGPCKAVKLPHALVDDVLRYARQLDSGDARTADTSTSTAVTQATSQDMRWAQVSALLDKNQEQRRLIEQLQAELALEKRKTRNARGDADYFRRMIRDARAILTATIGEHNAGLRKGIGVKDARSILLALTPSTPYQLFCNEIKIADSVEGPSDSP